MVTTDSIACGLLLIRSVHDKQKSHISFANEVNKVPGDGPAGKLLDLLDRHHYRPGHIHLIVRLDRCLAEALLTSHADHCGRS